MEPEVSLLCSWANYFRLSGYRRIQTTISHNTPLRQGKVNGRAIAQAAGRIRSIERFNDLIGTRILDLPP